MAPLIAVMGRGTVTGRDQRRAIVVAAPRDDIAWTARVADFAKRADLKALERDIWLTGKISPRARQEMTQRGWRLQDGSGLGPAPLSGRREQPSAQCLRLSWSLSAVPMPLRKDIP